MCIQFKNKLETIYYYFFIYYLKIKTKQSKII